MTEKNPADQAIPDSVTAGLDLLYRQQLRIRQRVYGLEAEAKLARLGRTSRMPVEFRSQFGEDLFIWDALGGQTEGFFIEVGAFDGYQYAVTYGLEAVGWNGLLIEAIPERYAQCKARRPHSRVVHAAVAGKGSTGTTTFTVAQDKFGGMLSYLDANSAHAKQVAAGSIPLSTVTVDVTTIDALLLGRKDPIDVAVIDVEGGELAVLDGFDITVWRPRLMLLEDNHTGGDPALTQYMAQKPYVHVGWVDCNRVYVRNDCGDIRERLMQLNLYA